MFKSPAGVIENNRCKNPSTQITTDWDGHALRTNLTAHIAAKIMAVGDVAQSRAKMIAHTELSKASSTLTRTRAEAVGSEGYIWRTSRDGNVRDSHRAMEGKFVRWQQPPQLDGFVCHAGER